jgi:hypothetical protein
MNISIVIVRKLSPENWRASLRQRLRIAVYCGSGTEQERDVDDTSALDSETGRKVMGLMR